MIKTIIFLLFVNLSYAGIYGVDDRHDTIEYSAFMQNLAKSVAAFIPRSHLVKVGKYYKIQAPLLKEKVFQRPLYGDDMISSGREASATFPVCTGERFSYQPTAANCTGFLGDKDIMMTAGHCVVGKMCDTHVWVFGYRAKGEFDANILIHPGNIYECKEIIKSNTLQANPNSGWMTNDELARDFAVIKLKRPVVGRKPLRFSKKRSSLTQHKVFTISYPLGLPQKIISHGHIFKNSIGENSFVTNLDTYWGSSGSPVFSQTANNEVIGMLIMGQPDFRLRDKDIRKSYQFFEDQHCFASKVFKNYSLKNYVSDVGERVFWIDKVFESF